jgi:ABC-2 type transport system permease protein
MKAELRTQAAVFACAARASFAYRPALLFSMISAGFAFAIPALVWRHVYAARQEPLSLPASSLFPYLILAGALNFVFAMGVEARIGQRIRSGLIATDLLRPADFQVTHLTQAVSDVLFNAILVLPLILVAHLVWGADALPQGVGALLGFGFSALLALVILFGISFIFVQATFITYSGYGVFVARNAMQQTFSGLSAPLVLFPPSLRAVAEWLPFRHTIHTPVSIYLGHLRDWQLISALASQLMWGVGLLIAGRVIFRLALRRLEIQGG